MDNVLVDFPSGISQISEDLQKKYEGRLDEKKLPKNDTEKKVNQTDKKLTTTKHQKITSDFFKLEMIENITPENADHPFWITKGHIKEFINRMMKEFIDKKREENLKNARLLNHGFPIIKEEINEIMNFYRNGSSIKDIEQFFQRSEITIKKIIEKTS